MASNAVTQTSIAKELGISQRTVSKALRGAPALSEETRRKVLEHADRLGYRVNRMASTLRGGNSRIVGVLSFIFGGLFFNDILHAIMDGLHRQGYKVMVTPLYPNYRNDAYEIETLLEYKIDGLITIPRAEEPWERTVYPQLIRDGLPVVAIDRRLQLDGVASVSSDDIDGMRQVVRHLTGLGHRRLVYLGPYHEHCSPEADRFRGFVQAAEEAGVKHREVKLTGISDKEKIIESLLSGRKRATALCCFSDLVALDALPIVEKMGLKVPEDFSIVGYGDTIPYMDLHRIPLTTVSQTPLKLGEEATRLFLDIVNQRKAPEHRKVPTRLIVRGSSGPVLKKGQ